MSLLRPLLLAVLLTLTACGPTVRHVLVPPTSMEGRRCVAQCQNTRQQCEQYNQMAYYTCQNNYSLAMHNYRQCVHAGSRKAAGSKTTGDVKGTIVSVLSCVADGLTGLLSNSACSKRAASPVF